MRTSVAALLACAFAMLLAPQVSLAGTLTDVSDAGSFPHRTWILSLPDHEPTPGSVRVYENGAPVADLHVSRSGKGGRQAAHSSATILVIDASNSMGGKPIQEAMAAARAFAELRRDDQALGVIAFNRSVRVLLEPTTDGAAIDAALRQLPDLALWTHMGDAVQRGVDLLQDTGTDVNSLVLLSDGHDTAGAASLEAATERASTENVRIFTVALRSKRFTREALVEIATSTGGTAAVADSPRELRGVFAALGVRLSAEYLVRYRSTQDAGARVSVEANVEGPPPEAVAEYEAPAAASAIAPGTLAGDSFWASSAAMAIVIVSCMLLVALAIGLLVYRPATAPLPERIAAYAPPEKSGGEGEERRVAGMAKVVEQMLSATGSRWERFVEEVDVARVRRSPSELALAGGFALALLLLLGVLTGIVVISLLGFIAPIAVVVFIRVKAARERAAFAEQLADNLQVFASALRAGHSFTGALGTVVRDAPEPTHREFSRALADERVGVPIDEALARVGKRMRSKEMTQVAMIAALQQETGGNTAEVLDRVVDNVRQRQDLRRLVRTLTAQGRISQVVVTVLPFALALLLTLLNPGYLSPLFESTAGWAMVFAALVMIGLGYLALRRIVNIRI